MTNAHDTSDIRRPAAGDAGGPDSAGPAAGAGQGGAYAAADPPGTPPGAPQAPTAGPAGRGTWQPRPDYSPFDPRRKSPALACILSLVPGLGQVYLGYYQRGFVNILVVAGTIGLLSSWNLPDFMYPLLGMFLPFFWLYNIVDAGRRAAYLNAHLEGQEPTELPRDIALPTRGSIGGGITLIVVGSILLVHTLFDVSLEWLEYWWPLIPILLGFYLVMRALGERGRTA